ncbi:hard-surface inducible [Fusarium subglutinans]|uniref:Hard-surface inducible n=1 Tax=Gibberella subglutinans TaxID=42677 RepID=A0A8H5Q6L7_GIBSU|nr:hard-surface inducible [Fusarium subglutinans]KAF5609594.1 hard-surface inducible [Fusarium subglutinans]
MSGKKADSEVLYMLRSEKGVFVHFFHKHGLDDAPILGYKNESKVYNPNMNWKIERVPGTDTRILFKSELDDAVIYSKAKDHYLGADQGMENNDTAHWYLEGCDFSEISEASLVRFRNAKHSTLYLDWQHPEPTDGKAFVTGLANNNASQIFRIYKVRKPE